MNTNSQKKINSKTALKFKKSVHAITYDELEELYLNGTTEKNIGALAGNTNDKSTKITFKRDYLVDSKIECFFVTINYYDGKNLIHQKELTLVQEASLLFTSGYCFDVINTEMLQYLTQKSNDSMKDTLSFLLLLGAILFATLIFFNLAFGNL